MAGIFGRMVVGMMPIMPRFLVGWVSRRYVAGATLDDAVAVMKKLSKEGACFTLDVLGEEITTLDEAQFFSDEYERVLEAITSNKLEANISIKPTAFGLLIDQDFAYEKITKLLEKAASNDIFVRLDMEDHRVTQATIDVIIKMHERGLTNVGTVLQGRLFRTSDDVGQICSAVGDAADFRICKGIYLESEEIAHTGYTPIVDATNSAIDLMLDKGAYVAIASHDKPIINHALLALEKHGMGPNNPDPREGSCEARNGKGNGYEFQMLLGVRGNIRRRLSKQGHLTRVYIPYGDKWYEYGMRRLRENPDIAWHITKSILMPWTNRR
ncbi:MAG: proline dehydrogenase family protein [Candidatus Poseidoniaceae archaeon]|jgi:proline dehydrogenase|nr:proline dehydrogenase family protein [Candidatus Poseidoniaceae archaeon]MDP7000914.1 proline dehydrogenase family protein [Candidatus Poseidoniaceae archaeon]